MDWYKKTAATFGTDPFGSGELSSKTRTSPWGHAGGDTHSGLLEPSSGQHHANDYFSEDKKHPSTEKMLKEKKEEDAKKKKKKKKKKKNKEIKAFKNTICDNIDALPFSSVRQLAQNVMSYLEMHDNVATHRMIGLSTGPKNLPLKLEEYNHPDNPCETICDIKQLDEDERQIRYIEMLKGMLMKILNELQITVEQALSGNFEDKDNKTYNPKINMKPTYQREYVPMPPGLSKDWYQKAYDKKYNYAKMYNGLKTIFAQFGTAGPDMPFFDQAPSGFSNQDSNDWFSSTINTLQPQKEDNNVNISKREKEPQDIYENLSNLTATVYYENNVENTNEIGSGFFINSNTLITCAHVVVSPTNPKAKNEIIIKHAGKQYKAYLYAYDSGKDIAAVVINDQAFQPNDYFELGDSNNIKIGDDIVVFGSPLGFDGVMLKGEIASKPNKYQSQDNEKEYIFMSANITHGNSGGPVVLENTKKVIGIAAAVINTRDSQSSGLNAIIPVEALKDFLSSNGIVFNT